MQPNTPKVESPANETNNGYALLHYEIGRVKASLEVDGESPTMCERLRRLEELLETCLAPEDNDQPQ